MAYIPKSKIQKKTAPVGLLMYKDSRAPYQGPYILTHEKRMFAGHSNIKIGKELIRYEDIREIRKGLDKKLSNSGKIRKYGRSRPGIKDYILSRKTPPSSKPRPNPDDYEKGYFRRYFTKKINGNIYIEIDKKTYINLKSKSSYYDTNLYEAGYIIWFLRENVHEQNANSLKLAESKYPNLIAIFPTLDEYVLTQTKSLIKSNLYTDGGELYFADGREYKGSYHIHPHKGPMEGPTHTSQPHHKLYYTRNLPVIDGTPYEEFIDNQTKKGCFVCRVIRGMSKVIEITSKKSKMGCPPNSYSTRQEAITNCIGGINPKGSNVSSNKGSGY